jgi:hypothetical protein
VEMAVRIDMVERQAGGAICLELRGDLLLRLAARGRAQRQRRAVAGEIVAQIAVTVDQRWYARSLTHRVAVDEDDMKPDPQAWQTAGAFDRVGRGRSADHEACGAQHAAPVRFLDGGVDVLAEAEIVGRDDQMVQ